MCSCLGFIMIQRDKIAIHGGVVVIGDNGVIFTGDRESDKSTPTTALRNRGYRFISDYVAPTYINKIPYAYPDFPYQKLCDDIVEELKEKDQIDNIIQNIYRGVFLGYIGGDIPEMFK